MPDHRIKYLPEPEKLLPYIIIIYMVGLVGLSLSFTEPLFRMLVPVNILLAVILTLVYHQGFTVRFIMAAMFIAVAGFWVEWAGVATGKIFGVYHYGETLGLGWDHIPFLIGINWFFMVYASYNLVNLLMPRHTWLKPLLGATIMTLYDFILEPVAIRFDFWIWEGDQVPLLNYFAWFFIAFVFIMFFRYVNKLLTINRLSVYLFLVQIAFFASLTLVDKIFS